MATYGPQPSGFALKTFENILAEMEADLRAQFGPTVNTSSASVFGQLNAIMAKQASLVWEGMQAVYEAGHIDGASGVPLRRLVALTGTIARPAQKSTVTATVNINPGVTIAPGTVAAVSTTGARFVTVGSVTNGGGSPANFSIALESEQLGPIRANANTLTIKITSVAGWNSITNPLDAVEGGFAESDNSLRTRQQTDIRRVGSRNLGAIRAAVLEIPEVLAVNVTENNTDFTVGVMTPHSIRVMIYDGPTPSADNTEVAQKIFETKSEGIETIGAVVTYPTDDLGNLSATPIRFDRAAVVPIWVKIRVRKNANFPADGVDLVKQAVVDYGDDVLTVASPVYLSQLSSKALLVPGVIDVVSVAIGTSFGTETAANFISTSSQVPDLDTGRVTVEVI